MKAYAKRINAQKTLNITEMSGNWKMLTYATEYDCIYARERPWVARWQTLTVCVLDAECSMQTIISENLSS